MLLIQIAEYFFFLSNAPFQRVQLAVVRMFGVESAELKIRAVCRKGHAYPA